MGALFVWGCAPLDASSAREAAIVNALVRQDERELRGRPRLVEGKFARMARMQYDFYRGELALFRADLADGRLAGTQTEFDVPGALPFSIGDAHPENFGLLLGRDERLALEPNDLDAADRYPYFWDLRRLTVGLVLASRAAGVIEVESVLQRALDAYIDTLAAEANGTATSMRIDAAGTNPVLVDLFRRGERDRLARAELQALTEITVEGRRFVRGAPDAADPENTLASLPDWVLASLPVLLAQYRATLESPPEPAYFAVRDVVREFGTGVSSWPRIRILVLVEGPSLSPDDDVILEIKEEAQSGATGIVPLGVYADDEPARIRQASRAAWALGSASEPLWSATTWLGMPVQIRRESEAHKTIRIVRLTGDSGTLDALRGLASTLGALLARIQGGEGYGIVTSHFAERFITRLGDARARFITDEVTQAVSYADQVETDYALFREALRTRGPRLGFNQVLDVSDRPSGLRAELYGEPPRVEPWE